MTPAPPAEFQVAFLQKVQRILAEGSFVATYKFALLHALADLAVLRGDRGGGEVRLSTFEIAEKFAELYWRQTVPFPGARGAADPLRQNTGRQAAVVQRIEQFRREHQGVLARAKSNAGWRGLVKDVEQTVKAQPLWKLQTVGGGSLDFLYANVGKGTSITLKPGIAFCLRSFYGLVTDLARARWVQYIRQHNAANIGSRVELAEFLFGSDRESLSKHRGILADLQHGACFYCRKGLREAGEVDHFVPWSLYSVEFGHNFVLAHKTCNGHKSDRLAALPHLERWCERNEVYGGDLCEQFDSEGILHDAVATRSVAVWAYDRLEAVQGQVWLRGRDGLEPLHRRWRHLLRGAV